MKKLATILFAALLAHSPAMAQSGLPTMQMPKNIPASPEPTAIPLYSGVAPGSESWTHKEVWTEMFGEKWVRNITRPTLTPFLPKKGTGNGAAVLVIPGGGFQFVSISNEGWPIAQWLADHGVAAFVLKYRTQKTPETAEEFGKGFMTMMTRPRTDPAPPTPEMTAAVDIARADAQTALKMIRGNAAKWGIDTKRVGLLGFSAGAMTTMATTLADAPDARPDFIAPIYGFMTPVTPPAKPQPMFAALAADDPLFGNQGFGLIESWKKVGGSVELHMFSGGGHGFGSHKKGTTSDMWFDEYMGWLKAKGFLKAAK